MSLAENLRRLRIQRYLSQSDLAKLANVSKQTVMRTEQGKYTPYPRTILALAAALDVPPTELIAPEELLGRKGKAAA